MEDVSQIRRDYKKDKLDINTVPQNPLIFFDKWMKEVLKGDFAEPTAFVLSTVSAQNTPSSRIVLLKEYDEEGFTFFTNYSSKKGSDISDNNNVSMLFFWDKYERQVRVVGKADKISIEDSERYFKSRPYTSRIGAWASKQSQILSSRFTLMRNVAKYMSQFRTDVPIPEFWGGYKIIPTEIEFWQGRSSRLHDRIKYIKANEQWDIVRLYP
ncbi:MAG TPA: pyridoxamine 5'-phosphate oxidase [Candidatus Kapabacteria bacterium]|nr:pyridoxamine 5'-phosphate oxidase [Candidatus Kapabacteria bacterium]